MKYILFVLLSAGFVNLSAALDGPLIHTKLGALRGEYLRVRGKTTVIHSYLGVPFAKPPVGPLRLAPPQPVQAWEGVRDATKQPLMCLQDRQISLTFAEKLNMDITIPEVSEDCLYLNIYTPAKPAEDTKLPVMVWIHGGALVLGSASFYDGSALAAYQNVVVVLIQYRLGMLGFLSTGDDNAPGNMGFLDQLAALQWVQKNIQSFGGDPSSVTIFGESAGGVSVSLQVLSPLSTGLFHHAIAESGTAAMVHIMDRIHPMNTAMTVANVSSCAGTKPWQIVDCVMQMSTDDILYTIKNTGWIYWATMDGYFLPKNVKDILKAQQFNKVPLMNGVNNDECGWLLTSAIAPPNWEEGMGLETVKKLITLFFPNTDDWLIDLILEEYLGNGEDSIKNRDGFTEIYADLLFNIPAIKVSNAHRDSGAPVYMYEVQHPPSILLDKRPGFVKVDHGDEIMFVFGAPFMKSHIKINGTFTEEEEELCRTFMSYWGNFARTGSPNGPGLTHWPLYGTDEQYLGIGLKQQVGTHLKADRFTFMTQTLPKKIQEKQQQQKQKQQQQQQQHRSDEL